MTIAADMQAYFCCVKRYFFLLRNKIHLGLTPLFVTS